MEDTNLEKSEPSSDTGAPEKDVPSSKELSATFAETSMSTASMSYGENENEKVAERSGHASTTAKMASEAEKSDPENVVSEPSDESDQTSKLSTLQSSCVLVNCISISYILLPGGFALGGALWTPVILALVSLQSYISGIFVLEACARAEASENMQILTTATRHGQRGLVREPFFLLCARERQNKSSIIF